VSEIYDSGSLGRLEQSIDDWFEHQRATNSAIVAVDRGEGDETRWFVRMRGEEKEFTTLWFTLGQRTLRYETYVMPAPEENAEQLYESILRRNDSLVGVHFSIGAEDAVFLRGELPNHAVNEAELDRIVGTMFATVERHFPTLVRIGFASRFAD
jgi:hypothetical protein